MLEPHSPFSQPSPYRATHYDTFSWQNLFGIILVTTSFISAIYYAWHWIIHFWAMVIQFGLQRIGMAQVSVQVADTIDLPWLHSAISLNIETLLPNSIQWTIMAAVTAICLVMSWIISRERLPLIYLLRTIALMQISSLTYFYLFPNRLPMTVNQLAENLVQIAGSLLFVIPLLFAVTMYVFRLSWWWKILGTTVTLLYIVLFLPTHLSLILWLLWQGSVLWLPVIYFLFTFLPYVLILIAFYGYVMSLSKMVQQK